MRSGRGRRDMDHVTHTQGVYLSPTHCVSLSLSLSLSVCLSVCLFSTHHAVCYMGVSSCLCLSSLACKLSSNVQLLQSVILSPSRPANMYCSPDTFSLLSPRDPLFPADLSTHLAPSSRAPDSASADKCARLQIIVTYLLIYKLHMHYIRQIRQINGRPTF